MTVGTTDADLLDAIVRLVRLLDALGTSKVLAPLIVREIIFRLLAGGQGARFSHLLTAGADTRRLGQPPVMAQARREQMRRPHRPHGVRAARPDADLEEVKDRDGHG